MSVVANVEGPLSEQVRGVRSADLYESDARLTSAALNPLTGPCNGLEVYRELTSASCLQATTSIAPWQGGHLPLLRVQAVHMVRCVFAVTSRVLDTYLRHHAAEWGHALHARAACIDIMQAVAICHQGSVTPASL